MKVKVVTSFNAQLFHKYGKTCLDTWVKHLKLEKGSIVEVWINGAFPQGLPQTCEDGTPFVYKSLDVQSEGWKFFYDNYRGHPRPDTPPGQEFRFNFIPFSCKVYALAEAATLIKEAENAEVVRPLSDFQAMVWIDADVLMKEDVTTEYLSGVLGEAHLAWLDRGLPWSHGETGFIMTRTNDDVLDVFLHQANLWGSGQLFFMREWHDAHSFSSCVVYKQFTDGNAFIVNNLNKDMDNLQDNGLYPFRTSILNTHFEHLKGNLKDKV